ncbi:MAG: enolase C-terminal domain-like protein [Dongiaceae bacterium]
MAGSGLTIRDVVARAVEVPLRRPLRTAVGAIPMAPLVLVDLATEEGVPGRAYLFAYARPALAPLARLIGEIAPELRGRPVAPLDRQRDLDRRFRLLGRQGLVGMALAGLDMALWDALARAREQPLARLLGAEPRPLPAYDSFGMVDPVADEGELRRSVESGFAGIKIKIGGGSLAQDVATVQAVRGIVGPEVALMVDYNQSLDPVEAGRRIARLAGFDLHWVEEPVAAEDLAGHARVRAASAVPIQTGENWWFPRGMADAIAAGACDLAMPDVMKIGGVTGWMQAAALAEAAALPVSSHIFVEASAHLLAATPTAHWLEHLDLAGPILRDPPQPVEGRLTARGPGLGLDWDEAAIARLQDARP